MNIIIMLAGNNLSRPKLVSECYAEVHVTLTKHHNETHAMKMTNHNRKTAIPYVKIEEYQNTMAKQQSVTAERQGTVTNQHIVKA